MMLLLLLNQEALESVDAGSVCYFARFRQLHAGFVMDSGLRTQRQKRDGGTFKSKAIFSEI